MLVHLRGTGVQWNPADHLCMAGQVLCQQVPGGTWTLSGEIHAVEQEQQPDEFKEKKIPPRSMGGISQVYQRSIAMCGSVPPDKPPHPDVRAPDSCDPP